MAKTIIGRNLPLYKGDYNTATVYDRFDVVLYDGNSYVSKMPNNQNKPVSNTTYWQLLAKSGEFTEQQLEEFKAEVVAESKQEMDDYTDDKKAELDTYEGAKETELNTYATELKSDFDTNASSKTTTFNQNATEKTTQFNNNASNKTDTFDTNASTKTTTFNENATSKTNAFNTNATNKTTDFNDNASTKTTAFNTNASDKTDAFDSNASDKTDDFNDNATAKTTVFNDNAESKTAEFDEHAQELQQEVEELSANMPWNTVEGTEISVDDAAKYSRNKLELFGNTSQVSTSIDGGDEYDSPSPDHPQPIHVVTGENTIRFYKNLYNPKTAKIASSARQNVTNEILNFEKNKKYYVYANNNAWLTVYEYKGSTILNKYGGTFQSRKVEFTVSNEADRIVVDFYNDYKKLPTDYTNIYFCEIDEYIEYSDQQYIYPLNLTNIELLQINFYQDTFFKNTKDSEYYDSHLEENGWYLIQKIIKDNYTNLSSNRIEDVTSMMNNGLYGFRFYTKKSALYSIGRMEVFCTHFAPKYMGEASDLNVNNVRNSEGIAGGTRNIIIISLDPTRLSEKSTKAFGDYMKSINPIIAYILTTPIITPITDETLISQLDAIYEHLQLVKGTNIATITASDLAPNMQLSYMQDLPSKLDNLDSRLSLLE